MTVFTAAMLAVTVFTAAVFAVTVFTAAVFAPVPLAGSVPAATVMFAVMVVPSVFRIAETTDFLIPVPA
jgi:hypothetical protein